MELVKGQNLTIPTTQCLNIDMGWRSLKIDLNLQAHAIYSHSGENQGNSQHPRNHLIHTDQQDVSVYISRDKEGRHYSLNLEQLTTHMDSLLIVLMLPAETKYDFSKVKNLQALVTSKEGDKLATIKIDDYSSNINTLAFIEIYQHNHQWKIKLLNQQLQADLTQLSKRFSFDIPQLWAKTDTSLEPVVPSPPHKSSSSESDDKEREIDSKTSAQNASLREGITLDMGGSFSLTNNFSHIKQLSWKVRTVPELTDIKLNIMALDSDDKVRCVEDFVYQSNPCLKGGAIELQLIGSDISHALILLDKLPQYIDKLCLIATRASDSKRFSSADFIQTKVQSASTDISVCSFSMPSVNKNYNAIILLEIYKHNTQWKIKAVGQGYAQGVQAIGEVYGFKAPRTRTPSTSTTEHNHARLSTSHSDNTSTAMNEQISAPNQSIQVTQSTSGLIGIIATILGAVLIATSAANIYLLIVAIPMLGYGVHLTSKARAHAKLTLNEQNERFILNVIKQHHYQITPFEIAQKHPISVDQATTILDDLCSKGAGKLMENDKGSLIYSFESINSKSKQKNLW